MSPILSTFAKVIACVIALNRLLFAVETHKRMEIERAEDLYLKMNFCNRVDHREIGRHTSICLEADRRLASSVTFRTAKQVVDDTLHQDLRIQVVAQVTFLVMAVMALAAFHTKYSRAREGLPIDMKKKYV